MIENIGSGSKSGRASRMVNAAVETVAAPTTNPIDTPTTPRPVRLDIRAGANQATAVAITDPHMRTIVHAIKVVNAHGVIELLTYSATTNPGAAPSTAILARLLQDLSLPLNRKSKVENTIT